MMFSKEKEKLKTELYVTGSFLKGLGEGLLMGEEFCAKSISDALLKESERLHSVIESMGK